MAARNSKKNTNRKNAKNSTRNTNRKAPAVAAPARKAKAKAARRGSARRGPAPTDLLTEAEIDAFAERLKATVAVARHHENVAGLLNDFAASLRGGGRRPGRPAGAGAPSANKGRRRRRPGMDPAKVAAVLPKAGSKEGLSVSEVAAKVGERDKLRVAVALKKLREAGSASMVGEKRLARWFGK